MDKVTQEDRAVFNDFIAKGKIEEAMRFAFLLGTTFTLKEQLNNYESEE